MDNVWFNLRWLDVDQVYFGRPAPRLSRFCPSVSGKNGWPKSINPECYDEDLEKHEKHSPAFQMFKILRCVTNVEILEDLESLKSITCN